jgi:hypothetical protein
MEGNRAGYVLLSANRRRSAPSQACSTDLLESPGAVPGRLPSDAGRHGRHYGLRIRSLTSPSSSFAR